MNIGSLITVLVALLILPKQSGRGGLATVDPLLFFKRDTWKMGCILVIKVRLNLYAALPILSTSHTDHINVDKTYCLGGKPTNESDKVVF